VIFVNIGGESYQYNTKVAGAFRLNGSRIGWRIIRWKT